MAKRKTTKSVKSKLTLANIKANTIEESWLDSVVIDHKRIEISNSWEGFIMLLITILHDNYKSNTIKVLYDNNVFSSSISTYRNVVIHPSYDKSKYSLYKLRDLNVYIEFKVYNSEDKDTEFIGKDYIHCMKAMFKLLNRDIRDIEFCTVNLEDLRAIHSKSKDIGRVTKRGSIDTLISDFKASNIIKEISLFGNSEAVDSCEQLLLKYTIWMCTAYSDEFDAIDKSKISTAGIGICTAAELDEKYSKYKNFKIGGLYLYYVDDQYQVLQFIKRTAKALRIPLAMIQFTYSELVLKE